MSSNSRIEWTDASWNPIVGCSIVSPGCINCYAMRMAARIGKMTLSSHYSGLTKPSKGGPVWTGKIALAPEHIFTAPLRWKRPRMVFVNSMGDLFHEDVPDEWIDKVFAAMALAPQHVFQVLTKRAKRMRAYVNDMIPRREALGDLMTKIGGPDRPGWYAPESDGKRGWAGMHILPPNIWLGISAERQQEWDERTAELKETPAAVHFVSAEPLLGPIDGDMAGLDWIIVGGESGPGARPMHPDWARSLRDQCLAAGVAYYFKQWGAWLPDQQSTDPDPYWRAKAGHRFEDGAVSSLVGKKAAGRLLDGREWNEMPEVYRG